MGIVAFALASAAVCGKPPNAPVVGTPPGKLELWLQRQTRAAWAWVTEERRTDVLWGPIAWFAVRTTTGYVGGIGFDVVRLEPRSEGRLEITARQRVGFSLHGAVADGDRVYLAAGYDGLVTVDASRPGALTVLARDTGHGYALSIAKVGGFLLLAYKEGGGVAVYRLRDRGLPEFVKTLQGGQSFGQVVVEDRYAYVVGSEKLLVFDIRDPGDPTLLSETPMPYRAVPTPTDPMPRRIALSGHHALVAHGAHGIVVVDVADPRHPRIVSRWDGMDFCDWIQVHGATAYAASEGTPVQVADITDPVHPVWRGTLDLARHPSDSNADGERDLLPLALGARGLFLLDARDPANAVTRYAWVRSPYVHRVSVVGHTAYATAAAGSLQVYDLTDVGKPRLLGVRETFGLARGLRYADEKLWVADVLGWLLVLRPVDGSLPELVAVGDRGGHPWDVDVEPDVVWLANGQVGLGVLRRAPEGLEVAAEGYAGAYSIGVASRGNVAYLATIGRGVVMFELEKATMTLASVGVLDWPTVGPFRLSPVATAVTVSGDTLLVGDPKGKLRAYALDDPTHPRLLWTKRVGGTVFDVVAEPDGVWVSAGSAGVLRLDLDLTRPTVRGRWSVPGTAMSTARCQDRVLVAAGDAGLVSLEIGSE